jgi:hypothetical protein
MLVCFVLENGPGLGRGGPRLVDVYLWFHQRMIYKLLVTTSFRLY